MSERFRTHQPDNVFYLGLSAEAFKNTGDLRKFLGMMSLLLKMRKMFSKNDQTEFDEFRKMHLFGLKELEERIGEFVSENLAMTSFKLANVGGVMRLGSMVRMLMRMDEVLAYREGKAAITEIEIVALEKEILMDKISMVEKFLERRREALGKRLGVAMGIVKCEVCNGNCRGLQKRNEVREEIVGRMGKGGGADVVSGGREMAGEGNVGLVKARESGLVCIRDEQDGPVTPRCG